MWDYTLLQLLLMRNKRKYDLICWGGGGGVRLKSVKEIQSHSQKHEILQTFLNLGFTGAKNKRNVSYCYVFRKVFIAKWENKQITCYFAHLILRT